MQRARRDELMQAAEARDHHAESVMIRDSDDETEQIEHAIHASLCLGLP